MALDFRHEVWLYCEKHADGQLTDGKPMGEGKVYEIVDHLVCVPAGKLAEHLLTAGEISVRFGGLQRVFIPWYRYASEAEVQVHLAKHVSHEVVPDPEHPANLADETEQPIKKARRGA